MVLGAAMPLVVSAYLGIADAAVDLARDAVVGRTDPATIAALGAMTDAHLTAVDGVAAMFADSDDLRFDNTDEMARRTLSRKTRISDALIETVTHALELAGGRGYSRSSDLERLYRDVLGSSYHPLPRARQVEFTGRVAAGLSPIG
jgi:acyl-CoA dehydrogenase